MVVVELQSLLVAALAWPKRRASVNASIEPGPVGRRRTVRKQAHQRSASGPRWRHRKALIVQRNPQQKTLIR